MSSFFDNFMGGLTIGLLASNPFFRGMGGFGFGCGCGYGGVGGFIFGGMYNAVNLNGFINPFPSIFGGGYMGGGYASSAGLIMPTGFANNSFPTVDFEGPMQTIWDTYNNPDSDYNKQMRDLFQKMNSLNNSSNPFDNYRADKKPDNNQEKVQESKQNTEKSKQKQQTKVQIPENKSAAFNKMLDFVFEHEGGEVNHPNDKGGHTNMGVTQSTYDSYRKDKGLEKQSVKNITKAEATEIYKMNFEASGASKISDPRLAMCVFDWANHSGPNNKALQKALKECNGDIEKFIQARSDFLHRLIASDKTQESFRRGWDNRINDLRDFVANDLSDSYA